MALQEPKERMRILVDNSNIVLNKNMKITMYYNSGIQMAKMAKIYFKERDFERAYVLCLKYVSLFLEILPTHPEYLEAPENMKASVKSNMKEFLLVAEKLKAILLAQYEEDYRNMLAQKEAEKEKEKKRDEERAKFPAASAPSFDIWEPQPAHQENDLPYLLTGGLRNIVIPNSLIPKFMQLAKENTGKNIETCGLLTGTLQRDVLTITVLLIPQQTGTADECTAENDLATFNAIETRGLFTFGWIHTHPSQDAFLSSVDLHSQFGYQSMLPEALAIVCAPRYSNQVFRLSDMGLQVIGDCCQRGFHPHPGPPMFETASHSRFCDVPCEVVDLRNSASY